MNVTTTLDSGVLSGGGWTGAIGDGDQLRALHGPGYTGPVGKEMILSTNQDLLRKFKDISEEEYREYDFGVDEGTVKIVAPLWLHVSASGGHRILDNDGISWYIPARWCALRWKAKPGYAAFRF
jgi:hypothetical protein